jgi:cAMP phosphodiesterase
MEDNTTALLVRSTSTSWGPNSVLAVDAGVHLAAISRIMEQHSPAFSPSDPVPTIISSGPFKDLKVEHRNPSANAIDLVKDVIGTHLMTHPHLDHIAGFVVNTSGFDSAERKTLAGMPTTIEAIKKHIFNGIIWPNLSDENGGFSLVTYLRMIPGGNPLVPNGGYVKLCDGLHAKGVYIAHGHCNERHFREPEISSAGLSLSPRSSRSPISPQQPVSARSAHSYVSQNMGQEILPSEFHHNLPETENMDKSLGAKCITDSTAYFIRDVPSEQEIIVFGDLESDSISGKDLNRKLWVEAAPKMVAGLLKGLVIEVSYPSARPDMYLFGHLTPVYLIEELQVLAGLVEDIKFNSQRSQQIGNGHTSITAKGGPRPASLRLGHRGTAGSPPLRKWNRPLKGLKVVIIHVKETLNDGPSIYDTILRECEELNEKHGLGCEFVMGSSGQAVYF